jgi:hypothetical protein
MTIAVDAVAGVGLGQVDSAGKLLLVIYPSCISFSLDQLLFNSFLKNFLASPALPQHKILLLLSQT